MEGHRYWLRFWAAAAVALAFADASIVVLALPQIVARLHTSISHVVWVIAAYNLALIVGSAAVALAGRRVSAVWALIGGLVVFGLASVGSAVAQSLAVLVVFRAVQGLGGALLLCGSLPFLGAAQHTERLPLGGWAAVAALGAALGPASGGLLTQLFDWRAIFIAQAPVAFLGAATAWVARREAAPAMEAELLAEADAPIAGDEAGLPPLPANLALGLLSAGLIGALFLVTVLLINVWGLTPLSAAIALLAIPLSTAAGERLNRHGTSLWSAAAGALSLTIGLLLLGATSHKQVALAVIALILSGAGLGLAFPVLTSYALRGRGAPLVRVARTIAARDAGLVIGLLVLTPVFVNRLGHAQSAAVPPVTAAVVQAPISQTEQLQLGVGLLAAVKAAPQSELPNIGPAFARVERSASPAHRATLAGLQPRVQNDIVAAATRAFRRPVWLCAVFAVLVLPLLGIVEFLRRRRRAGAESSPPAQSGASGRA